MKRFNGVNDGVRMMHAFYVCFFAQPKSISNETTVYGTDAVKMKSENP